MRAYVDADLLIWQLRGDPRATECLRRLAGDPAYEMWLGAMQRAEIVCFMRPEEEAATVLLLSQLRTAPVDQAVVDDAARLYRQWHASHGLDLHDALLAATAMRSGGRIYTLNLKHYPMPEVSVERAWPEDSA
ncbi:MAG: PIN domain-containing protein [Candidatus Latescibacterota bacterium]